VPGALVASRLWPVPVFVGLLGLAPVSGCGEVTSGQDLVPAPPETDASFGGTSNSSATDAASSCHPVEVVSLQGTTYQPAAVPSGACLGADGGGVWEDFYEDCLGPDKSDVKCNLFKETPSNAACAACVLTPYNADHLGPILSFGEFVGGNVAGCIEVESTAPSDLQCAQTVQALSDCEIEACQANCPVTDPQSLTARQKCASEADQMGLCLTYSTMVSTCRAMEADGGVAEPCTNTGFKAFYDAVVPLFCGQATVDAAARLDAGSADAALGPGADSGVHATDAGTD
jgi:hypothetical protein